MAFEKELEHAVDSILVEYPKYATPIYESYADIVTGTYKLIPEWFVDSVCQYHGRNKKHIDIYDAYVINGLWGSHIDGDLYILCAKTKGIACPDADTDGNNLSLSTLHPDFTAKFMGGPGDCDGKVIINDDITMISHPLIDKRKIRVPKGKSFDLEVGYTSSSTTNIHISRDGGVARFPYGYEMVIFMANSESKNKKIFDDIML